jgi:solute carrier family 20 (sodium-dependent phosphate transporter)
MAVYDLDQYLWLVVVGCFFGFTYAFGIGANDVANAFASTVASKSLTLKQAVMVASIFEFSGAFFLGASVTSTIRSKIFDVKLYADEPEVIMLGMFTSLFTATVMLLVATHYELPVSTTHTIVGCMIGFSIVAKGFDSIEWDTVQKILLSWVISPGVSALVAFIFFATIRYAIMRHENSFQRAYYTFPIVLLFGIGIDLFYILVKGTANAKNVDFENKVGLTLGISFGTGAAAGLIWIFGVGPIAKRRVEAHMQAINAGTETAVPAAAAKVLKNDDNDGDEVFADDYDDDVPGTDEEDGTERPVSDVKNVAEVAPPEAAEELTGFARLKQKFEDNTYGQDLKTMSLHENKKAAQIWEDGEVFDPDTEQLFTYIQVFTACLNSFAHGANDVANAIAPISALVDIYQNGEVEAKSQVQKWILAYGGIGIVVGLLLYGYKIMKSLGYKMTILSPSRGSCAELAASLFVVTASFLAIPVSSTQSIVGAVVGVGLAGGRKNVQWLFFLRVCLGWVALFFSSVFFSALVFAMFAYTPSLSPTVQLVSEE